MELSRSWINPYFLQVVAASLCFAVGGIAMKYSDGLTRLWPSLAVFALFVLGAALQTIALRNTDLSVTYIVVLGLEAIAATLFGVLLFQEALSPTRALAIGLVVCGVALLK